MLDEIRALGQVLMGMAAKINRTFTHRPTEGPIKPSPSHS